MSDLLQRITKLSPKRLALLALDLQQQLEAAQRGSVEPIAIVGLGCRFPGGANGPDGYWDLLREGRDAIREVPRERWDVDAWYDPDPDVPGKMSTRWGGFLDGDRPLRSAVLRDLAARSGKHGPAAAPAARGGVGGARARRPGARPPRRVSHRRLRRRLRQRLLPDADGEPHRAEQRLPRHRHRSQHRSPGVCRTCSACRDRASRSIRRAPRRSWPCIWPARACGPASAAWRWRAA